MYRYRMFEKSLTVRLIQAYVLFEHAYGLIIRTVDLIQVYFTQFKHS